MNAATAPFDNFTSEHYEALGQLVVKFQQVDWVLTSQLVCLMWPLASDAERMFTFRVLNEMPYGKRLLMLGHFIETHDESHFVNPTSPLREIYAKSYAEEVKKMRQGLNLARDLEQERNQFIHSHYISIGPPIKTGSVTRIKTSVKSAKKINYAYVAVTAQDIQGVVAKGEEARDLLFFSSLALVHMLRFPDGVD
jgi:hypothetical protein